MYVDPEADLPSNRDMARGLRRYLEAAEVERRSLLHAQATSRHIVFHDLRGTGVTWHAVAGTDPLKIQQWAGHTDFQTTQGYLGTADAVGRDGFGVPFPPLPPSLLDPAPKEARTIRGKRRTGDSSGGIVQGPGLARLTTGILSRLVGGADGTRTRGLRRDRPAL